MSNKLTPSAIFARTSAAVAANILSYLFEKEKPLYKATVEAVAKQRKLRPVFIERKPRNERFPWLQEALGRRASDAIAAHILQTWLVGQQCSLLCDFLDGLGIAHEKNGTVDQLPSEPTKEALEKSINDLFQKHDPEIVAIYINAFIATDTAGWTNLESVLESDARLQIGKPAA